MNHPNKRLTFLLPGLYGGGAERVMLNLAAGFAEKGFSVDLVLAEAVGPYLSMVPEPVRVVELNGRRLKTLRTVACLPALIHYLRRSRPAVLVSALQANFIALWAKGLTGLPRRVVISEHNTFSHQARIFPKYLRRLWVELTRHFYPWSDGIIAVSEGVADDLAKAVKVPRDTIQVIYNPVVTPEVKERASERCDHPWFNNGGAPIILSVGRLTAQKDFGTLIEAFSKVRQNRSARLVILGEGEERERLESTVRKFNMQKDVMLPGFVPNPYSYMARASLFVLSSRWEGLPTVLVEALYCGAQIIATDCPSGPREILNNGLYGSLVPVGRPADMAQAIDTALNQPRPERSDESWRPYEYETVVNQYMNTLLGS